MSAKSTLLAINGGTKTINQTFSAYNTMGPEEVEAAGEVVKSGVLSDFVGAPGENFLGGDNVKAFEHEFKIRFDVKNAVSVNSWTSGLIAMVGALGIEPGDEYDSYVDNDGHITIIKKVSGAARGILKGIRVDRQVSEDDSRQNGIGA